MYLLLLFFFFFLGGGIDERGHLILLSCCVLISLMNAATLYWFRTSMFPTSSTCFQYSVFLMACTCFQYPDCQNSVRLLVRNISVPNTFYMCSTGAYKPIAYQLRVSSPSLFPLPQHCYLVFCGWSFFFFFLTKCKRMLLMFNSFEGNGFWFWMGQFNFFQKI